MENDTRKNLEETMNILYERADVCPFDSEDYYKLLDRAEKIGKLLNEEEKTRCQHDLELRKYEDSKDWRHDWRFWIVTVTPFVSALLLRAYDRRTMIMQTREICNFERDNSYSTYAGKGLASSLRFPQIIKGRD